MSEVIQRSPAEVYAYASNPDNLPDWAAGLALGEVTHDVTRPSGETITNPVRVLSHPDGCEIVFTVRQRDLSDKEFDRDAEAVAADLARSNSLLEAQRSD